MSLLRGLELTCCDTFHNRQTCCRLRYIRLVTPLFHPSDPDLTSTTYERRHWKHNFAAAIWKHKLAAAAKLWVKLQSFRSFNRFHVNGAAWGGLIGPVDDAARFVLAHLNGGEIDGRRILSSQSVASMQQMQLATNNDELGFGLGWNIGGDSERRYLYHMGGGAAFFTEMRVYPGESLGIVIMGNASGNTSPINSDLRQIIEAAARVQWD